MNAPHQTAMHFLVVDDHPLFREALQSTLRSAFRGVRVDEAGSIDAALELLDAAAGVDLILLDLSMQGLQGFEGMIALRKRFPLAPVLIVSGLDDRRLVHEALCLGASGFVPKASDKATLTRAISTVLGGSIYVPERLLERSVSGVSIRAGKALADRLASLTPAQRRVLGMIRQGKLNKEIAAELDICGSTVKTHVSEIIRKLGVISRTQIVIETARLDLETMQQADR